MKRWTFRKKEGGNNFKIITWNIAGVNKVRGLKDYLGGFDIIALQETWLEREGERDAIRRLDKNFRWIAKAAEREKTKGRAKWGVLAGIRKEIKINRVVEWRYGLILKEVHIK